MDANKRILFNANDDTYEYLQDVEKRANDELAIVRKFLGEDISTYMVDNIFRKALGLPYDHYYEESVNDRIECYHDLAKNVAIRYIRTGKQEDYDKAKELLNEYDQLKNLKLIEIDNPWNCVNDKIYEVKKGDDEQLTFEEFNIDQLISEAK